MLKFQKQSHRLYAIVRKKDFGTQLLNLRNEIKRFNTDSNNINGNDNNKSDTEQIIAISKSLRNLFNRKDYKFIELIHNICPELFFNSLLLCFDKYQNEFNEKSDNFKYIYSKYSKSLYFCLKNSYIFHKLCINNNNDRIKFLLKLMNYSNDKLYEIISKKDSLKNNYFT